MFHNRHFTCTFCSYLVSRLFLPWELHGICSSFHSECKSWGLACFSLCNNPQSKSAWCSLSNWSFWIQNGFPPWILSTVAKRIFLEVDCNCSHVSWLAVKPEDGLWAWKNGIFSSSFLSSVHFSRGWVTFLLENLQLWVISHAHALLPSQTHCCITA